MNILLNKSVGVDECTFNKMFFIAYIKNYRKNKKSTILKKVTILKKRSTNTVFISQYNYCNIIKKYSCTD